MQHFIFKVGKEAYPLPRTSSFGHWLRQRVLLDKLQSPFGYLLMCVLSLGFAFWIGTSTLTEGWTILLNVILIPCLLGAMLNQRFGLMMMLLVSFSSELFHRYVPDVPITIYLDAFVWIMLFGILVRQTRERNWSFLWNPISAVLLCWLGYVLLQIWNPISPSLSGWAEAARYAGTMLLVFYVGLYAWKDRKHLSQYFYLWMGLVGLAAVYALFQAWGGLPEAERDWLMETRERFQAFYTLDSLRVFSIFRDPSSLGITLSVSAVLGLFWVGLHPLKRPAQIVLGLAVVLMLIAMVYTRTRTAYVILLAGISFFALLRPERKILIGVGSTLLLAAVLAFIPTENNTLKSYQSAFSARSSFSYQTQMENLQYVQPYIRQHTMGAGMGITGDIGLRHTPYTLFSEFPAASGFVRVALEMGWLGLGLFLALLASVLWVGVRRYFRSTSAENRLLYQLFLTAIVMMVLANYLEPVLLQVPTNLLFLFSMAGMMKLAAFEEENKG